MPSSHEGHAGISLGRASQSSDGAGDENNSNVEYSTSMENASTVWGSTDDLLSISRETTAVEQRNLPLTAAAVPSGPQNRLDHHIDVPRLRSQLSVSRESLIASIRNLDLNERGWSQASRRASSISGFQQILLSVELRSHQLHSRDSDNLTEFERTILGHIDREMQSPSQNIGFNPNYLATRLQFAFLKVVKNWLREQTPRRSLLDRLFNRHSAHDGRSGTEEASGSSSPGQSRRTRR